MYSSVRLVAQNPSADVEVFHDDGGEGAVWLRSCRFGSGECLELGG